jgi:tRNA A-37 threonylcarbamoyl transferase component Bud32
MDEWLKLSWEGMDWLVRKGYEKYIPHNVWDKAKDPERFPECKLLKNNILRTSIIIPLSGNRKESIFLKRHHRRHWKDDLKSLFIPSRAFTEWKILLHFNRLNIPAPSPLAYGEKRKCGILKESSLITEAISKAQSLNLYLSSQVDSSREDFINKEMVLSQLAKFIAQLHHQGIYFRDLHGGNILCQKDSGGKLKLLFVDVDKARFILRMTSGKRIRDLAMLFNSFPPGTERDKVQFLKTYLKEVTDFHFHWKEFFEKIDQVAKALRERHLKSRNKRCLKKTTSFEVKKKGRQKHYFRKEVSDYFIEQVLNGVKKAKQNEGKIEENGKITLFRIKIPKTDRYGDVWVRYYRYNIIQSFKSLISFSPGKRAWFNSNGLRVRGVLTPLPLALVEEKGVIGVKESILITEDLSFFDRLDDFLLKRFAIQEQKNYFVRKIKFMNILSKNLHQLYEKKIYFKNLTAKEILVEEETGKKSYQFYFGTVNRVIFNHRVSAGKQIENLIQLHKSIPEEVGWKDRFRFLFHFSLSWPREKRKDLIRKVLVRVGDSLMVSN